MIYYGIPQPPASGVGYIVRYLDDDNKPHALPAVGPLAKFGFAWGIAPRGTTPEDMREHAHRVSTLALSLCAHALGDPGKAARVAQRVKHRTTVAMKWSEPWTLQAEELFAAIDDAKDSDQLVSRATADVARDRPPVGREDGMGMTKPIKWEPTSDLGRAQGRQDSEDGDD